MMDLIKKTLLAGVGATVVTKEKIESALQDFVKQGKVSTQEARELAHRIAEDGRKEYESVSADLGARVRDMLAKADFASAKRVEALEERVKALETELANLKAGAAPTA